MRRFSLVAAALAAVFLAGCARNEEIPWGGAVKPSEITIAKGESRNLSFIIEPEGASYIGLYPVSETVLVLVVIRAVYDAGIIGHLCKYR